MIQRTSRNKTRNKESKQQMEEQNSLDAMDEHIQGQQETHKGRT